MATNKNNKQTNTLLIVMLLIVVTVISLVTIHIVNNKNVYNPSTGGTYKVK